ncbi:hypothetical protein [Paenimyroides aestuarii]|uniref:Lipoprotein n=1 Tax=Paenimyroides aestuarii TaxID=2968490 RepID=A0ABY5NQA6_9FLAO|nr:hypothetical protein [Paenimyroides aestuarii]UUV20668.1 hypothetical protein NPX36_10000 [Paenimyroides aestuarii]
MTTRLNILLFIILTACNSKSADMTIGNVSIDSSTVQIKTQLQDTVDIKFDTIKINDHIYIQTITNNHFNCLLSIQGDTIVKSEHYYFEAKFLDIDEDGYKDIRVFVFSNTPNQCDNYLFDKKLKKFKHIENCDLDIQKIKGTDFLYSYNRAGCADMNWESHLSKIENYKLVDYGYIYGQGCDFEIEKNPQVIEIYKVNNLDTDDKKLIKKLSYQKHIKEFGDKWDFIEKYWTKNYKTFE